MKPLDTLMPRILVRAKGCPDPVASSSIRAAATEFCERTRLWRDYDTFKVSGGCEVVCTPYGAVLHEIESARFNGMPLEAISLSDLDHRIPNWRTDKGSVGQYITQIAPNSVRVVPMAEGELHLSLTLKPSDSAEELPDFIVDQHWRPIVDGALAEILTIPGQPFYNPDLAMFHSNRFRGELDRLFNSNIKGQQRAPTRTKPQFF